MKNLVKFVVILNTTSSFAFIESVDKLAKQSLKVTEQIKEVQIDEFHEDKETVDYWYSNAKLQKKVREKTVHSKRPCKHVDKVTVEKQPVEQASDTKLALMVRYNNKELTKLNFPINKTPEVGSYLNKIFAESPAKRRATLNSAKGKLSFEEKIALASYLGKRFDSNYDFQRAKSGSDSSQGIITLERLIDGYNRGVRSGICRDIAVGQAQIMNELGLDCKVTGYVTSKALGHATMVCSDPKDPDKTVRINYGEVMATNASGTAALNQNGSIPGTTVTYRMYNKDGEFITGLKTDLGKMLTEVSGGKAKEIDWQEKFDSNVAKVDFYDIGSVFYGETSDGHSVVGVAKDMNMKYDLGVADLKLSSGGSLSHVKNEYSEGNEQGVFFFRAQADLDSKPLKITKNNQVKASLGVNQTSAVHIGLGENNEDNTNSNLTLDFMPSLKSESKITESTVANVQVGSKFEVGKEDVREEDGAYMISRSADFIHTSLEQQLTDSITAVATATVINRNQIGRTGQVSASAQGESFKSTLIYDSRLDDKTPGYIPGATPTVTFKHEQEVTKNISVYGGGSKPLKGNKQSTLFMGVKLKY